MEVDSIIHGEEVPEIVAAPKGKGDSVVNGKVLFIQGFSCPHAFMEPGSLEDIPGIGYFPFREGIFCQEREYLSGLTRPLEILSDSSAHRRTAASLIQGPIRQNSCQIPFSMIMEAVGGSN